MKDSLQVEFKFRESEADSAKYGRPVPFYSVEYDFVLIPGKPGNEVQFSAGRARE